MSPAPHAADSQPDRQLKILARAFEALLLTTQQLSFKQKLFQQRLEYAHDEYLKLAGRTPQGIDPHTKIVAEKILARHIDLDNPSDQSLSSVDVVKDLSKSGNVGDSSLAVITEGVGIYKSFLSPDNDGSTGVVATRAGSLERDFTTKGTRGSLRCPFSKPHNLSSENGVNGIETALPSQNGDTCGFQQLDPIKEEQMERQSSQAPSASVRSSNRCPASRCPIRFLDQHSPEEIADYVERHKHEIPRSHAICVKRYSNSSRQLDAKYGDLTNMIRGLSEKHQAFLPGRRSSQTASSSAERVEKWAEEVKPQPPADRDEVIENDEERKGHFDRPLREVRVGESPSRPWGIHVPIPPPAMEPTTHAPATMERSTDKPLDNVATSAAKGRCPFGHGGGVPPPNHPAIETDTAPKEPITTPDATSTNEDKATEVKNPPNLSTASIVFNGPVFFGFSPEQTAEFMQELATWGHNKS
ncbi:hypothetical protein AN9082.2 [Aspergillus nidulans FGSC A4]|uniref:Uncharacterized protein n=1 Tax=Emericella nidulans (strain FGSC A4 / ATCC 38163 / CBS 112.46 / NRRL 194 / M139) TaxID=227321 RepID=Q5ARJ8_EMENI|nr:hypothetical protein [Aspergillus nidulans FGSC A4]EAA61915.1 hypothetical protein AN9082.2 [Aspergillus nidulans FGSC A4]CBF82587.1 TPA: conserved hypothetical protein [Aspergillus nidulans FGSC A4]|eukprot:XP_682351.1 hypothetical protein AN9082.2 [Aspergillus nidulans FGSC A4]